MIKWDDAFCTGDDVLDSQHQLLFDVFNNFETSIQEKKSAEFLKARLPFLESYIRNHFDAEERCMHRKACVIAGVNKEQHCLFIKEVDRFKALFDEGQMDNAMATKFHQYLEKWFVNHVLKIDTNLNLVAVENATSNESSNR